MPTRRDDRHHPQSSRRLNSHHKPKEHSAQETNLLERDELGTGGKAGTTVRDRSVRDRVFAQVRPNHFRLDFNRVEHLTVVHADDGANHFRDDRHVAQVRAHRFRLLHTNNSRLRLAELLDEVLVLAGQAIALEATTDARVEQGDELVILEFQQSLQVEATVGELLVRVLLARLPDEGFFFGGLRREENTKKETLHRQSPRSSRFHRRASRVFASSARIIFDPSKP